MTSDWSGAKRFTKTSRHTTSGAKVTKPVVVDVTKVGRVAFGFGKKVIEVRKSVADPASPGKKHITEWMAQKRFVDALAHEANIRQSESDRKELEALKKELGEPAAHLTKIRKMLSSRGLYGK